MVQLLPVFALLSAFGLHVEATNYPATYPFDMVSDLPRSEPIYEYSNPEDPGGYFRFALHCDYSEYTDEIAEQSFLGLFHCGAYWYRLVTLGVNNVIPPDGLKGASTWNCSVSGAVVDAAYLNENAVWGNTKYSCPEYVNSKPFYTTEMSAWAAMLNAASCADPTDEFACMIMFTGHIWCFEYYLTPGTRQYILPCMDQLVNYFTACPTFFDPIDMTGYDSARYVSELSTEQSFIMKGIEYSPDRVCHPLSYYNPESNDSSTESTSDDSADSTTESSSSMLWGSIWLLF